MSDEARCAGEPLEERKQHILHALYYLQVEHRQGPIPEDHPEIARHDGEAVDELVAEGLVAREAGGLRLTEEGVRAGADVVRRHRLAERLMSDVLGIPPDAGDYIAGEMEHIVSPELTTSICTLLGHPTECPHGNPIPPGPCCEAGAQAVEAAVVPLTALHVGERGTVAYLSGRGPVAGGRRGPHRKPGRGHGPPWARGRGRQAARRSAGVAGGQGEGMGKRCVAQLTSLGVFPGEEIVLLQRSPAYVIRVGGTTLALDENMASCIRVRRGGQSDSASEK